MAYAKFEGIDESPLRATSPSLVAAFVNQDAAGAISAITKVTQVEYDLLTPDSTTLYVIVG